MRRAAVVLGLIGIAATVAAQQPTFRSNTGAVVSIFATVTDRDNRLVPDLTQEDFEVLDNDQPQPLVLFENETRPITVVVMLDTSFSMNGNIKLLKEAAEQFIIRLLPDDKAKVGAFNDKIEFGGALHQQPRRSGLGPARPRLRQRHAPVRRGRDEPRRAGGSRRTARAGDPHRRGRYGEPRRLSAP